MQVIYWFLFYSMLDSGGETASEIVQMESNCSPGQEVEIELANVDIKGHTYTYVYAYMRICGNVWHTISGY